MFLRPANYTLEQMFKTLNAVHLTQCQLDLSSITFQFLLDTFSCQGTFVLLQVSFPVTNLLPLLFSLFFYCCLLALLLEKKVSLSY